MDNRKVHLCVAALLLGLSGYASAYQCEVDGKMIEVGLPCDKYYRIFGGGSSSAPTPEEEWAERREQIEMDKKQESIQASKRLVKQGERSYRAHKAEVSRDRRNTQRPTRKVEPRKGMRKDKILQILGKPDKQKTNETLYGSEEIWTYRGYSETKTIVFDNGTVSKIVVEKF